MSTINQQVGKTLGKPRTKIAKKPWYKNEKTLRKIMHYTVTYFFLFLGVAIFLVPFVGMFTTALKGPKEIFAFPLKLFPERARWENFYNGWYSYLPFTQFLINSVKISTNAVIGNLVSCALPAFAFARLRARGSNILFGLVLATMILPQEVTIVPQYLLFTNLGWNNTHLPLMVPPWLGWPFFIFLLRQFFMTLPKDLDAAARIDGANSWQIFWHIILPLAKPALATIVIFSFMANWNNFLGPLIYLRDEELLTLPIGLLQYQSQFGVTDYHHMMAVAVIMLVPVLILFLLGQKLFVQGIALTGMKG
ncbi:MAG: carbohydrate ABC transporter permease [Chloroflexi bacterium]|nr:MAG: carbohydrate ABC transporter permease [Chloroflexota bacterium]